MANWLGTISISSWLMTAVVFQKVESEQKISMFYSYAYLFSHTNWFCGATRCFLQKVCFVFLPAAPVSKTSTCNSLRSTYHTAWHQKQPVTICKQVSWNPTIPIPSVSKVKDSEGLGPVGSIDRSTRLRSGRTCEQEHVSLSNAFLRPRWIWDAEALYFPVFHSRLCENL